MSAPTSDKERKILKTMVSEMTFCLEEIDNQREQMKDIASEAVDKFDIPKKLVNKMARTMYKQAYADLCAENEHFEELYENVIENKKLN